MGSKILLDFVYAADLSVLDENVSKMKDFLLEGVGVQGTGIGLKPSAKNAKSLRLGTMEAEEVRQPFG